MGNPAYDARREAERAEAEQERAAAEAAKVAFETFTAFFTGKATLHITPMVPGVGTTVRVVRDAVNSIKPELQKGPK